MQMLKPSASEYREYFSRYIDLVPEGNFIHTLTQNTTETAQFFGSIPTDKHEYSYADGKWTPKQVLLHIIDTERIFTYRALAAVRGDSISLLPSYDENLYAANADGSNRTMEDILEEFAAIRLATKKLFENVNAEQSVMTANVFEVNTSARALGYVIIGHTIHHIRVIKERYL